MSTDNRKLKILLVDDQPEVLQVLKVMFREEYDLVCACSGAEAIELVDSNDDIKVVVLDIKMAEMDGITAGRKIREIRPDLPVIFHTAYPGEFEQDQITKELKPFDYVTKGSPTAHIIDSVKRAVQSNIDSLVMIKEAERKYGLIARSLLMQKLLKTVHKIANSNSKVMIVGEMGSGKKHIARIIHSSSDRHKKPFVVYKCGDKTPEIIESEQNGDVVGGFSGVNKGRFAPIDSAHGGTVLFDKIDELDLVSQLKIRIALESYRDQAINSNLAPINDVRIICSSRNNLSKLVEAGKFREDLYLLFKSITIQTPSLRDRPEDIPHLANIFLNRYLEKQGNSPRIIDNGAMSVLLEYPWPGNVKQLINTIENMTSLSESDLIIAKDVVDYLDIDNCFTIVTDRSLSNCLSKVERKFIIIALVESNYSISNAAEMIDVDRSSLSRKIKKHNIDINALKQSI